MSPSDSRPGEPRWGEEIEAFLADASSIRNPRSVTATRSVGGRLYNFKHAPEPLGEEARALELAAGTGDVAGVRAVTLTVFDPRANVLVTETEPGRSLFNGLWNESSRLALKPGARDWPAVLGRSAAWLAAFHRASGDSESSRRSTDACLERLRGSFSRKLAVVRETVGATGRDTAQDTGRPHGDGPLTVGEIDGILARVDRALEPALWRLEPVRRVHGDFTPTNQLLLHDGSIRVLDFADSAAGFALEDVVRLWSAVWEVSRTSRRRERLLSPALSGILTGYGLTAESSTSTPFRVLRLWNAVVQASVVCSSRAAYGLSTRWIHRRLAGASLSWLRREIAGDGQA